MVYLRRVLKTAQVHRGLATSTHMPAVKVEQSGERQPESEQMQYFPNYDPRVIHMMLTA